VGTFFFFVNYAPCKWQYKSITVQAFEVAMRITRNYYDTA